MNTELVAIVIAAGGDGMRIGGSKPGHLLGGIRLIDRAAAWARQHSDVVALAVRPDDGDWGTGLPLLVDRYSNIGPISALASAFRFAQDQRLSSVLMIGCDMPFLPNDLLARLCAALPAHGAAMPLSDGHGHPMATLWVATPEALDAYIERGGESLRRFAKQIGLVDVPWDSPPDPFMNINQPADLLAAEEQIKRQQQ